MEFQTFQGYNSLLKLTTNTLQSPYDWYSEVSAPYSVTVCIKAYQTLPPIPEPLIIYQHQPCTYKKNQDCASLSCTYKPPDSTEDMNIWTVSCMTTDACQLKNDLYENVISKYYIHKLFGTNPHNFKFLLIIKSLLAKSEVLKN